MNKALALFIIFTFYGPFIAAADSPPTILDLKKTLVQEVINQELVVTPNDIELVLAEDGESYQAIIGTYLFSITIDGDFIIFSNFFEQAEDLTNLQRARMRRRAVQSLREDRAIVFPSTGAQPARYTLTVFADASCPFCAKFHKEVPILNEEGVEVRYVAFPREGVYTDEGFKTRSYEKTVSVWCNADPHRALARAMAGEYVRPAVCDNPIEAYYSLGESFGIRGTPAIVFDNGDMWVGYYSAIDILEYLGSYYPFSHCPDQ